MTELPPDAGVLLFPLTLERRAIVCQVEAEGDPVPWSRTGTGKLGQHYNSRRYNEHREVLSWALREGYVHGGRGPLAVELGLWCTFVRATRRRVDIDNLAKAVMDAGTGIVWADDSQVTLLLCRILINHDEPRTEVVVYRRELEVEAVAPSTDAL